MAGGSGDGESAVGRGSGGLGIGGGIARRVGYEVFREGIRDVQAFSQYNTASEAAGNDPEAQFKAISKLEDQTECGITGTLAQQLRDPGGHGQAENRAIFQEAQDEDRQTVALDKQAEFGEAEQFKADQANTPNEFDRRSNVIERDRGKETAEAVQVRNDTVAAARKVHDDAITVARQNFEKANERSAFGYTDADEEAGIAGARKAADRALQQSTTGAQKKFDANTGNINKTYDAEQTSLRAERETADATFADQQDAERAGLTGNVVRQKHDEADSKVRSEAAEIRKSRGPAEAQQYLAGLGAQEVARDTNVAQADESSRQNAAGRRVADEQRDNDATVKRLSGQNDAAKREEFVGRQDDRVAVAQDVLGKATAGGNQKDIATAQAGLSAAQNARTLNVGEFDINQQRQRVDAERGTQDEITKIQEGARVEQLRAAGETYQADRQQKFDALDQGVERTQRAAASETDATKREQLQRRAAAEQTAAASEEQSFDAGAAREDREGAADIRARGNETVLRASGDRNGADELSAATHAADEIRNFKREGRPEEAKAARAEFIQRDALIEQNRAQDEHRGNVNEEESKLRAEGKGAEADYVGFRDREADNIRDAEKTGDKNKIAQARRTAENDIKAFQRGNQKPEKPELFGSTEEFSNHLLLSQANGPGQALARASTDLKDLQSGKDLHQGDAAGGKLNDSAKKLGDATAGFQKLIDNAKKLVLADI